MGLSPTERETVLNAVRLLAKHGLDAAETIRLAVSRNDLQLWELDEAVAQLEDIQVSA